MGKQSDCFDSDKFSKGDPDLESWERDFSLSRDGF